MSAYPRPIHCARCQRDLIPEQNGVWLVEMMKNGDPYKLWKADLWKCPICGVEIVSGYGKGPISYNHEENFEFYFKTAKESGKLYYNFEQQGGEL